MGIKNISFKGPDLPSGDGVRVSSHLGSVAPRVLPGGVNNNPVAGTTHVLNQNVMQIMGRSQPTGGAGVLDKIEPPTNGGWVSQLTAITDTKLNQAEASSPHLESLLWGANSDPHPIQLVQNGTSDTRLTGVWTRDPSVGHEPPAHWPIRAAAEVKVGVHLATFKALMPAKVDASNVDDLMARLKSVMTLSKGQGDAQLLAKLNANGHQTLSNGNLYVELEHGFRLRSGPSTAQLFVFGLEVDPLAVGDLKQRLEASVEERRAK